MKTIFKYRVLLFALLVCAGTIMSCSKMDDYKKYTKDGEISYTGKIDSLKILPGKNRVLVSGLFISDPKVTSCRIFWNNRADSMIVPVVRTLKVDSLKQIITGLAEGVQNFEIVTYDSKNNPSIKTFQSVRIYGDEYQRFLINRPIADVELGDNGTATIKWGGLDKTLGIGTVVLTYTKADQTVVTIKKLPKDTTTTTLLPNYKYGTQFSYTTEFLPDSTAIDTFYPLDKTAIGNARTNVTATYVTNPGTIPGTPGGVAMTPVSLTEGVTINSATWRKLAGWTSNAQANNWGTGYGTYGTWVARTAEGVANTGSMSMEAGKNTATPALNTITNGKIYQTKLLPAGEYSIEARIGNASAGTMYLVASAGTEIPNIQDLRLKSSNINFTGSPLDASYKAITTIGQGYTMSIDFKLDHPTTVSFGFVATLTGNATTNQYLKITAVKMKALFY